MNRIAETFTRLKEQGRKGLILYVSAGDPTLAFTENLVPALAAAGADIVELGLPFSDPLADGPVIQAASQRALAAGASAKGVLALAARIRKKSDLPLALMTYYNPVFRYGEARFVHDAAAAAIDALIVPDLPLEESSSLRESCRRAGLGYVTFVAPTSTPERIASAAAAATAFIYGVTVTGVTGMRRELPEEALRMAAAVKDAASTPLALGFGISGPAQAKAVATAADAVIVGSALVSLVAEQVKFSEEAALEAAQEFVRDLRQALDS
ncbi:MAG TPA: tryptophan synthase subunit alpha [Firmicutes bacterium]|nr:tryptophan synthase subunit alpha [Bacillota bacterium]